MASGYRHVSYEERCQIDVLRKEGRSMAAIGRLLGRDVPTISRELGRHSGGPMALTLARLDRSFLADFEDVEGE